ncbi:alpha-ketoglutarate-dependent dioxygenase alkB-like protein [Aureococcus anophagefferens]|nr:alpha-ketoglutarate-dependent dioxygenase alkB-like protein [Aureococcus anophagefferens]
MAVKELTEVMVTGTSDPRLVDVAVKHASGSSSFVKKRITDNHAWKFYAGASGKGKDNDYFHHAALTHLVDFYVAKRIDAKTSKSRRSTLSLDKRFYRFITWTQGDPIGVDDDDVFFADKSAKWSASPVEGCKSDREYRSGVDRGPEMRQSDGWTRTTIILKPPSGDDRSSVIAQGLAEKGLRLAALAPKIRKGDVVALGISQSERDAQGVDFYLAKVVVPPARADNQRRVNGSGRDGWNIKKGEFCLTVRWFDLKPCGYYEDYGSQDEQLLEMVIAVGDGAALVLEPAPRKGRARGAPAQFQLAKASEAAIHNENLDKRPVPVPHADRRFVGGRAVGGVRVAESSHVVAVESSFRSCYSYGGEGGAAWIGAGSSGAFENCTFDDNDAGFLSGESIGYDRSGGAIAVMKSSALWIVDSTFTRNYAQYGGALWLSYDGSAGAEDAVGADVRARGCSFESNHAQLGGGHVAYADGPDWYDDWYEPDALDYLYRRRTHPLAHHAVFDDCEFLGGSAQSKGGAIRLGYQNYLELAGSTLSGNACGNYGGALFTSHSQAVVERTRLDDNSAGYGGAILAADERSVVYLDGSTATGNYADVGGFMYFEGIGHALIGGGATISAAAAGEGGAAAFFVGNNAALALEGVTTVAGVAGGYGGSVYLNARADLSAVNFRSVGDEALAGVVYVGPDASWTSGNASFAAASVGRGTVFVSSGILDLRNATFGSCEASSSGATLYAEATAAGDVLLENVSVAASSGPGSVSLDRAGATLRRVRVVDAFSDDAGAGLAAVDASLAVLEAVEFRRGAGPAAPSRPAGPASSRDCVFAENGADYGGVAALFGGSTFESAGGNRFVRNAAERDGGVFFVDGGGAAAALRGAQRGLRRRQRRGRRRRSPSRPPPRPSAARRSPGAASEAALGANEASYGDAFATNAVAVSASYVGPNPQNDHLFDKGDGIVVEAFDRLNATVATLDAVAELAPASGTFVLIGDPNERFDGGVASYTEQTLGIWDSRYPDGERVVLLNVSVALDSGVAFLATTVEVALRGCVRGEVVRTGSVTCEPCGVGYAWWASTRFGDDGWSPYGTCESCGNGLASTAAGRFECGSCAGTKAWTAVAYAALGFFVFGGILGVLLTERGQTLFMFLADARRRGRRRRAYAEENRERHYAGAPPRGRRPRVPLLGRAGGSSRDLPAAGPASRFDADVSGAVASLFFARILPTRCLTSASSAAHYEQGLAATALAPFAFALITYLGWAAKKTLRPDGGDRRRWYLAFQMFLLFLHLILPLLCSTAVQSLVCDSYDEGTRGRSRYLRISPTISCDGARWRGRVRVIGGLMVALYPAGIPLTFAVLLWRCRHDLNPESRVSIDGSESLDETALLAIKRALPFQMALIEERSKICETSDEIRGLLPATPRRGDAAANSDFTRDIQSFHSLWCDYEPRVFMWEIVEVARRVFFTALIAIVDPGGRFQLVVALAVSVVFTALYVKYEPFVYNADDAIAQVASWSVNLTLLIALCLRAEIVFHRRTDLTIVLLFAAALAPFLPSAGSRGASGTFLSPTCFLTAAQRKSSRSARRVVEPREGAAAADGGGGATRRSAADEPLDVWADAVSAFDGDDDEEAYYGLSPPRPDAPPWLHAAIVAAGGARASSRP